MTHLRSDARWTYAPEWTGHAKPRWVVRFCGDFVASCPTQGAALMRATGEKTRRDGALTVENIPHNVEK